MSEIFKLRNYQKSALNVINADLKIQKNVLLQAIMGAGKTVLCARLINRYWHTTQRRFLILAHKAVLVEQFYHTFIQMTDIPCQQIGICCTLLKRKDSQQRLIIGTIQTFVNCLNNYYKCDLLVIDEAHKIMIGTGSQYDQVIDVLKIKNPKMRILGLTATPFRMKHGYIYGEKCKVGNINLFSKLNYQIKYEELQKDGYLMELQGKICTDKELKKDLQNVDIKGDYVLSQLGQTMKKLIHIETCVEAIKLHCINQYKKICVFACTIEHAMILQEAINLYYPGLCTIIHSKLSTAERTENMKAWKTGSVPIMVSINILIEGFDFKQLDCLVMVRPTQSPVLWLQSVGRSLRVCEGKKKALLVDLTFNTETFGLDLDNVKVSIPKTLGELTKDKLEKCCPECAEIVHIAIRKCPKCDYEWTVTENDKIIAKQLPELKNILFKKSESEIKTLVPATWYDVNNFYVTTHRSKKSTDENKKKLGRIILYYAFYRQISIWFCFSDCYTGYAVIEAKKKWKQFSDEPFPNNCDEFTEIDDRGSINIPVKILVDVNEKWPQIIEYKFAEKENNPPIIQTQEKDNYSYNNEDIPF